MSLGRPRPWRDYYALELVANRAWDGVWSARFSYTLSKTYGNHEGGVNSDTGNNIPGWTEFGDDVGFDIGAEGPQRLARKLVRSVFWRCP